MAYSRHNKSTSTTIRDTRFPFARGSFKNVWRGHYTNGPRQGEECVTKTFKTGSVFEAHFFELEMTVIEETQEIINAWNNARLFHTPVMLSHPEIFAFVDNGEKALTEPFIHNFQKFNSNSGWAAQSGDEWSDALQALSHFSYHHSGGEMVLCDIQGGIYSDGL
ncbi:transcription-associated protein 1 [Diaporthe eres]|uniref:Transcription-associated protein 1 n=1 Tax=Diaporthe eres TaxID=83184 RepID=A0ABR1NVJ0_DIAER